ncbi:DddA-like double-stranded DNA deaminase toxin [Kribbella sp. NPDC050459]|uniref:DddA-like double-stranded DNA deaminase toxin n=1 Tax=Kribbella sp. NPDC050459 TaxID=3155785 RepID=UPI003407ADC1
MPSELQRVAEQLLACLNEAPRAVSYLHDRAGKCHEAAAWIGSISNNPSGRIAGMQLDDAARRCEEAAHYLSQAEARAKQWVEQMVSGIRTAEPSGGLRNERSVGPRGSTPPGDHRRDDEPEAIKPDKPARASGENSSGEDGLPSRGAVDDRPHDGGASDEPEDQPEPAPFIEPIFRRLPERPGDVGPTAGILTRPDGGGLIHVRSGTRGPGGTAPGLGGRTASLDSAREHAEGHAAALMRRAGMPREMTLYVNKRPCGGRYGCDNTLPWQLPPGAKLTVYWPGGYKVYIGDGRGLA